MKRQITSQTAKDLKEQMYEDQEGECLLCLTPLDPDIQKNHLDHDHIMTGPNAGKVRGLLCLTCNVLDGVLLHKYRRSGLVKKGVEFSGWFVRWMNYITRDYSSGYYHPQYIVDMIKLFKRLSLIEMRKEMDERGFIYDPKDKKTELVKKFGKQFRKYQKSL